MGDGSQSLTGFAALRRSGAAGFIESRLHVTALAHDEGVGLYRARCSCGRSGFEAREPTAAKLVFVERGAFRRRTGDGESLLDVGFAYFVAQGCEEEFAHPTDAGDVTTLLIISPKLIAEITGGELDLPKQPVGIDSRTHRAFRSLLAEATDGVGTAWVESGLDLFGALALSNRKRAVAAYRATTRAAHGRLVEKAREALIANPGLGVAELARLVGCSPFHLSRVFRREMETTISDYRLRLRIRNALGRIRAGEENLARLAGDLGFSDHSHLTRMLVRELGETPTTIRRSSSTPNGLRGGGTSSST